MSVSHGKLHWEAKSHRRAGWGSVIQWFEVRGWWEEPTPPLLCRNLLRQTPGSPSTFDATCQPTKAHLRHLLVCTQLYHSTCQKATIIPQLEFQSRKRATYLVQQILFISSFMVILSHSSACGASHGASTGIWRHR